MGFRFLDKKGKILGQGGKVLSKIVTIDKTQAMPQLKESQFYIACDVATPFYGKKGVAYTYGFQKGANKAMVEELDKGLESFAQIIEEQLLINIRNISGAGAAGGLGG